MIPFHSSYQRTSESYLINNCEHVLQHCVWKHGNYLILTTYYLLLTIYYLPEEAFHRNNAFRGILRRQAKECVLSVEHLCQLHCRALLLLVSSKQ